MANELTPRDEMLKALNCLYIQVPEEVAKDIEIRFHAYDQQLQRQIAEAEAAIRYLHKPLSHETKNGKCFICKGQTDSLAGNPALWPLWLTYRDGNGKLRCYHSYCVAEAIADQTEARTRPVEGWMAFATQEILSLVANEANVANQDTAGVREIIARHAPDLEAIEQQARKDALNEAARVLCSGCRNGVPLVERVNGQKHDYGIEEYPQFEDCRATKLLCMADASPAEPPKEGL